MTWVPLHNNQPRLKNGQARERAVRTYRMALTMSGRTRRLRKGWSLREMDCLGAE
jgi:hypothetical protein